MNQRAYQSIWHRLGLSALALFGLTLLFTQSAWAAGPTVEVRGNNVVIANGDTTPSTADFTDCGGVDILATTPDDFKNMLFRVANTGTTALTVSSVTLSNTTDFSISFQPTSVAAGTNQSLTIVFNPVAYGVKTATVTITTNDSAHSPYIFVIKGTGYDPSIQVQGNGVSIFDGAATTSFVNHTAFGTVAPGSASPVRTW